jgi:hypothetical protein
VAQVKRRGAAAGDFISHGLGFGAVCRVKRAAVILNVRALDAWRASGHGTGPLADPFCGTATGAGERGRGTASAPREGYERGRGRSRGIRGMHQRWWFSWAGCKEAPGPDDADGRRKGLQVG